jgi:glyoxylase-like metal-dependent hydrolase (beta-lactamase superfamily II)
MNVSMRASLNALAALALVASSGAALAAETGPGPTAPAAQPFTLGKLKLISLADGHFVAPNDAKTFGVDAGADAVGRVLAAAGLPTDRIAVAVVALLVVEPGHVALLDTGLGPRAHGVLQESLRQAGYAATDITDVLITHTHGDHIGGLLNEAGASAFPKATIHMSTAEWESFRAQAASAATVKAIGSQVKTFEPGKQVIPAVTPVAIQGHTPGHMGYQIVSDGARLLDIGDTAHSSVVSLAKPDWVMGFDQNAARSKVSRRETLARLATNHELVFAPHFPYPGVGRVERAGDGFSWKPGLK